MNKGDQNPPKANNKPPAGAKPTRKAKTQTTKPAVDQPVPEITDMEVHHHPQLEHKPKPIKEYLLEGFMIFIAVMMGFVAENVRQVIDDNEHVKQLTAQLVSDLKADTAQLKEVYQGESKIERYNDTLLTLLQQPLQKADTRRIQKMVAASHSMWPFDPSAGAMMAIKNELHLKQFSNSQIISYFSRYEAHVGLLHTAQDVNMQYQRTYLDPFLTQHLTPMNMAAAFSRTAVPGSQMRDLSQKDLDQLAADIVLIRVETDEILRHNKELQGVAVDLLNYVNKHYRLENNREDTLNKKVFKLSPKDS